MNGFATSDDSELRWNALEQTAARMNMPSFGKRTPFTLKHLQPFIDAYGSDPNGGAKRHDQGPEGRFRAFSRNEIAARNDNLDLSWLRDDSTDRAEDLPEPDIIAAEILSHLQTATTEINALLAALEETK